MKTFGYSNGRLPTTAVPIGERCLRCDLPITVDDVGVVLPHMALIGDGIAETITEKPYHLKCFCRVLGIDRFYERMS